MSVCLQNYITSHADIIFIEYSMNDGYRLGPPVNHMAKSYERLIRKLLVSLDPPPAVVAMHTLDYALWGVPVEAGHVQSNRQFWATAETNYDVIAEVRWGGAANGRPAAATAHGAFLTEGWWWVHCTWHGDQVLFGGWHLEGGRSAGHLRTCTRHVSRMG